MSSSHKKPAAKALRGGGPPRGINAVLSPDGRGMRVLMAAACSKADGMTGTPAGLQAQAHVLKEKFYYSAGSCRSLPASLRLALCEWHQSRHYLYTVTCGDPDAEQSKYLFVPHTRMRDLLERIISKPILQAIVIGTAAAEPDVEPLWRCPEHGLVFGDEDACICYNLHFYGVLVKD